MENRLQRRHPLVQTLLDNWFYLLMVILMWRLPHLLGDYFDQELQPRRPQGNQPIFWMGVFIQLYILAILAMSYNLVFGFAGILSFGHALYFGLAVYTVIILIGLFEISLVRSVGVALGIAAIFGLLTALAVFRIKGVYFAMFTLASAQILYELVRVNLFKFLTQGDDGQTISNLPEWINPISNRLTFYYLAAFFAAFTFVFIRRLMNSPTGKVILAIRDNEERAQTMGYNTALYKALVITLAGMLAALSGVFHAIFTRQAEPTVASIVRTTDPLFMTIIGGTGTNPGPAVGAIVLHLGETYFRKPDLQVDLNFILFHIRGEVNTVEIWRMVLGVVFILIVLLIPYGVVGQLNLMWLDIRRWFRHYFYDPALRANPNLALRMAPFTGEPPEVAQALAKQSADQNLVGWAKTYPWAAAYSLVVLLALVVGLLAWDINGGMPILLLGVLILTPPYVGVWLYQNYERLWGQTRDFFSQFIR